MFSESYLKRRDIAQTLRIDELVKYNAELAIKLQVAETDIDNLKSAIGRLEDENLALTVKLEDANNEIGRLDMVLKRPVKIYNP